MIATSFIHTLVCVVLQNSITLLTTLFLGKGLFTTVGGFHVDPTDPNARGKNTNWDDLGSLDDFREFYKVNWVLRWF